MAVANDSGGSESGFGFPPEALARLVLYGDKLCRECGGRRLLGVGSVWLDVHRRYELT